MPTTTPSSASPPGAPPAPRPRWPRAAGLVVLLGPAGCGGDPQLAPEVPTATITSHLDGAVVLEGTRVSLVGAVEDPDDSPGSLRVTWTAGDRVVWEGRPEPDGTTRCELEPSGSAVEVFLRVEDPRGNVGTDSVSLVVEETRAPVAVVREPVADGDYRADRPVTFAGLATDLDDPPASLEVEWSSDLDGWLVGIDPGVDEDGRTGGLALLSEGRHRITLTARDPAGRTGVDQVTIDVGPSNRPPSCALDALPDPARFPLGELVTLSGQVLDPDQEAPSLAVEWASDLDGLLSTDPADDRGSVTLSTGGLSRGTHHLTLRATDDGGQSCVDEALVAIVGPPDARWSEPGEGQVLLPGEAVPFVVQVGDLEDPLDELRVVLSSDVEGVLHEGSPDAYGELVAEVALTRSGPQVLIARVEDSDGQAAEARTSVLVDGAPTAPVVIIEPQRPHTDDDLRAVVVEDGVDPEGARVEYRYRWWRDGERVLHLSKAMVPAGQTDRDETWMVEVIPTDGLHSGDPGTAETTIENTEPRVEAVRIVPDPPWSNADLSVEVDGWWDADPGDTESFLYEWVVDGRVVSDDPVLPEWFTTRGAVVDVTVIPSDGDLTGAPVFARVVVANTPGSLAEVTITPDPARTDDILLATPDGWEDPDGDPPGYRYQWILDGVAIPEANGPTLDGRYFDRGDHVWVEVTPDDGWTPGTPKVARFVAIENTPPRIGSVGILPSPPTTDDDLVADPQGWVDPDGDLPAFAYQWYLDGYPVGAGGQDQVLSASLTEAGDLVRVLVTPLDGVDAGPPLASADVLVGDSSPGAPQVHVTPQDPTYRDDLVCLLDAEAEDPDGDVVQHRFAWFVDDAPFAGTYQTHRPGDSVSADATSPGERWRCEVVANDGFSDGPVGRDEVEIAWPVVVGLSAGGRHACLLDDAGATVCWGDPDDGRLALDGEVVAQVDAGGAHTCAVDLAGAVVCVGRDDDGQVGGTPELTRARAAAAGVRHSCAIKENGRILCWGRADEGALDTSGLVGSFDRLSLGDQFGCAIDGNDYASCWGDPDDGRLIVPFGVKLAGIDAGDDHACGVDRSARGVCWGDGRYGQTRVPLGEFVQISAGAAHSCGVRPNGEVVCWGDDTWGQRDAPPGSWEAVAAGGDFSCAVAAGGDRVTCWGNGAEGQLEPPQPWW